MTKEPYNRACEDPWKKKIINFSRSKLTYGVGYSAAFPMVLGTRLVILTNFLDIGESEISE